MSDDAAFLAMICAHLDDDGPRLVYADWLDEQGQAARAEFIRVQCKLAKFGRVKPPDSDTELRDEWDRLRKREWALWHQLPTCAVFAPFAPGISIDPDLPRFWLGNQNGPLCVVYRGFVEQITCTAAAFLGGEECKRCTYQRLAAYRAKVDPKMVINCTCNEGYTKGIADHLSMIPLQKLRLTSWPDLEQVVEPNNFNPNRTVWRIKGRAVQLPFVRREAGEIDWMEFICCSLILKEFPNLKKIEGYIG